MSEALINKYRPTSFKEVIGQASLVKALRQAIADRSSHAFLFTGPSGCGKTTLARIAAKELGCTRPQEIDGATYTGIDNMRTITEGLRYKPLGEGDVRGIIVDECHALSKQAFQAVLKSIEEPPEWVYWFLCTTEPTRILPTIKTRCMPCAVKSVAIDDLNDLLDLIADKEKMVVSDEVVGLCAREAEGSPRQAISNLVLCAATTNRAEAAVLLRTARDSSEAIELARALTQGVGWGKVSVILQGLSEVNPESVRHVVRAYTTTVLLNLKSGTNPSLGLQILEAFSQPFSTSDGLSPLVLAAGKVIFPHRSH